MGNTIQGFQILDNINKNGFYGKMILETQPIYESAPIRKSVCPKCAALIDEPVSFCGVCGAAIHPAENTLNDYETFDYISMCRPKEIKLTPKPVICIAIIVICCIFCLLPIILSDNPVTIIAMFGTVIACIALPIYFLTAPRKAQNHYKEVMQTALCFQGVVQSIEAAYAPIDKDPEHFIGCHAKILLYVNGAPSYISNVYYAVTAFTGDVPIPRRVGEPVNVYIYANKYVFTLPMT